MLLLLCPTRLPKDDRQPFLAVAFVVPPAPLPQLEGVNVVVCDDSDQHDADFYGAVKVRAWREGGGQLVGCAATIWLPQFGGWVLHFRVL